MLELSRANFAIGEGSHSMAMSYGGDTLNTSIYLSRSGISTSYVTALGDDVMSDWLLEQWQDEGIDCSLVTRMADSVPGMYMIDVDDEGERSFLYWRKNSPASRLFDDIDQTAELFRTLKQSDYVYLSGISLGILPEQSLVVVKMGGEGCLSFCEQSHEYVEAVATKPVDTTAAGDSFNAGYLAARLNGSGAVDACRAGHALASKVIQHKGAIMPKVAS